MTTTAEPPAAQLADSTEPLFHPDAHQQGVLKALVDLQTDMQMSDREFAKNYLTHSATVWYRVKTGDYWTRVKDGDKIMLELERCLVIARRDRTIRSRMMDGKFHKLRDYEAIRIAISTCRNKPLCDPDRLLIYLAKTGGGKTTLCQQLVREFDAKMIEARKCWERGSFYAAKDIASALGIKVDGLYALSQIEDAIIDELNRRKSVLAIDEGEYFGPDSIDLIKLILNKTPTVIFLVAIPSSFEKWNRKFAHHAEQLRRRTHLLIEMERVTPATAAQFLAGVGMKGKELEEAGAKLAAAANEFGAYDLCNRVAGELHETDDATLAGVEKAIIAHQKMMGHRRTA